jgi:hypothetical protein
MAPWSIIDPMLRKEGGIGSIMSLAAGHLSVCLSVRLAPPAPRCCVFLGWQQGGHDWGLMNKEKQR